MTNEKIKGLVAATVTPMKANGEVNLPALDSYVKHLEKQGLAGVFVNGTTGEGLLMTSDERKAVAEAWMAYKDKFKVMVHGGVQQDRRGGGPRHSVLLVPHSGHVARQRQHARFPETR